MKLLPCPFCGQPAEADSQRAYRNMTTGNLEIAAAIYCTACSADMTWCYRDTPDVDRETAVASLVDQWNTRPGEPDNLRDDDRFNKGVLHAQDILNKMIGDPEYVASDGSEDYDTDLGDTILNQLAAAGLYDKEECRFATLAAPQS